MDFYLVMAGVGSSIACRIGLFLFFWLYFGIFGGMDLLAATPVRRE